MLTMPAFRIFICGCPTFHFIAIFNIFKNTLTAYSFIASLTCWFFSIYSIRTSVSILISMSASTEMQYYRIVRIWLMNLMAYPSQFRTIVSNLNLFLLDLFQVTYYFLSIIFDSTGPTS